MGNILMGFVVWGVSIGLLMGVGVERLVFAEETAAEKVGEVKDDAVKHTKKGKRKAKKSVREAQGKDDHGQDAKDSASDMGDEVKDKTNDVKNKID